MTCMNRQMRRQLSQDETQWNSILSEDTQYLQWDDKTLWSLTINRNCNKYIYLFIICIK